MLTNPDDAILPKLLERFVRGRFIIGRALRKKNPITSLVDLPKRENFGSFVPMSPLNSVKIYQ